MENQVRTLSTLVLTRSSKLVHILAAPLTILVFLCLSQSSATMSSTLLLRTAITRVFCSNIRYRFAAYRPMGLLARLTVAKNCLTIFPGLFPQAIQSKE